jgi:hypothetical protein
MKAFLSASVLALSVVGCAQMDAKTRGWLASKVPAYAVVEGERLEGSATLFTDRTGTLQLSTAKNPDRVCVGTLRYLATVTGVLVLRCPGGPDAVLNFTVLSGTSGFGYAHTAQGASGVTWGMDARNAAAYLPVSVGPLPVVAPIAPSTEAVVASPAAAAMASPVR